MITIISSFVKINPKELSTSCLKVSNFLKVKLLIKFRKKYKSFNWSFSKNDRKRLKKPEELETKRKKNSSLCRGILLKSPLDKVGQTSR